MRIIAIALAAAALAVPAMPAAAAFDPPQKGERAQSWRGSDGRIYCRRPNGTTGILVSRRGEGAPARTMDRRDSSSMLGAALGALLGGQSSRGSAPRCR